MARATAIIAFPVAEPRGRTIDHEADEFLNARGISASDRTIESYRESIRLFDEFLTRTERSRYVSDIPSADIAAFLVDYGRGRNGRPISQTSVAIRYRALRTFFNWLVDQEAIERSPIAKTVKAPKVDTADPPTLTD
jgi:site-specific recombinase XerD